MILIPDFFDRITPYLNGTHPVQQAFLHHLFPDSVPFPHRAGERSLGEEGVSYQKLGLLGYWFFLDRKFQDRFTTAFDEFTGRGLNQEAMMMDDLSAMIGIALGLRRSGDTARQNWWERQLDHWSLASSYFEKTSRFLQYLSKNHHPHDSNGLKDEFYAYLLLQGERTMEPNQWFKEYFVRTRKKEFPGSEESFQYTMLGLYAMDACFRRCIWEEDQIQAMKDEVLQNLVGRIEEISLRQGRWITFGIYLVGIPLISLCTYYFFRDPYLQRQWELLQQLFFLLGGPITLLFLLVKTLWNLKGRNPPSLSFNALSKRIAGILVRRKHCRFKIPQS